MAGAPPDLNDFRPGGRAPAGEAGGKKSQKYYYHNKAGWAGTNNLLMMMMMIFPSFPPKKYHFNTTKTLQTLKRQAGRAGGGRVQVQVGRAGSGIKKISPRNLVGGRAITAFSSPLP